MSKINYLQKKLFLSFILLVILFLTSCFAITGHNSSGFKYTNTIYNQSINCVFFDYYFDDANLYYKGITENEIDETTTIYKYIKSGIIDEFNSYNNFQARCSNVSKLQIKILFMDTYDEKYSRNILFNGIISSLTLMIVPLYFDYSYIVEFKDETHKFKIRKDFLVSASVYNLLLFFRYEYPFYNSFRNVTKDFIFDYNLSKN
jgi:hypothetical protein